MYNLFRKLPCGLSFVLIIGSISCGSDGSSSTGSSQENYEQNKMSLEDQEKANPTQFLSTDGTYRGNLFGGKMTLTGTITNSATVATFKDVNLLVHFYSKTQTEISSETYVIYEFVPPGQTINFESKVNVPDGTESVGWDVLSASAE